MEEFTSAFPQSSKDMLSKSSFMTVDHDIIRKDTAEISDIVDDCVKPIEKIEDVEEPETDGIQFNNLLDHCEYISCMKYVIPLSKLKGLQNELDIPEIVEFRCDTCANCPTCKLLARAKTKSLQESFEQEVIEKSVHVNLEETRVWVDLPFIKEPVEYLTKKHGGPNNLNQAFKVYQSQCKKRDDVKDQVRKAHGELVEKGYKLQLVDLPQDLQDTVNSAAFQHYYPWRAVYKEDSLTTPVHLVVDPTMTGLIEILSKGFNILSKIPELLVQFRCFKRTWNTDISKPYNQLHLNRSLLAFSLPPYHINGLENIADLLAKVCPVRPSDLQTTSAWHTGLKWMTIPSESLPCDQFTHVPEDLEEIYNQETFQEVENLHTDTPSKARSLLLSHTNQTSRKAILPWSLM
jgi:hypothetical protein